MTRESFECEHPTQFLVPIRRIISKRSQRNRPEDSTGASLADDRRFGGARMDGMGDPIAEFASGFAPYIN